MIGNNKQSIVNKIKYKCLVTNTWVLATAMQQQLPVYHQQQGGNKLQEQGNHSWNTILQAGW